MRYALAMILALGLGVSTVVPAASAADREGHESAVSTLTAQSGPSDPGTIAGPMGPYQIPVTDHDRN
jgi:hypothetical protein